MFAKYPKNPCKVYLHRLVLQYFPENNKEPNLKTRPWGKRFQIWENLGKVPNRIESNQTNQFTYSQLFVLIFSIQNKVLRASGKKYSDIFPFRTFLL